MRVARDDAIDVQVFGRLAKSVPTWTPCSRRLRRRQPRSRRKSGSRRSAGTSNSSPTAAGFIGKEGQALMWTLLVAVGFVLMIACANVSNLLLARSGLSRARDDGALGARRLARPPRHAHAGRGLRDQRDRDLHRTPARVDRARRHAARHEPHDGGQPDAGGASRSTPAPRPSPSRAALLSTVIARPSGRDPRLAALARLAAARRRPHGHGARDRPDRLGPRRIRGRARMPAARRLRAHDEERAERDDQPMSASRRTTS